MRQQFARHAAQHNLRKRAAPVRRHHDQAGVEFFRVVLDRRRRIADANGRVQAAAAIGAFSPHPRQLLHLRDDGGRRQIRQLPLPRRRDHMARGQRRPESASQRACVLHRRR